MSGGIVAFARKSRKLVPSGIMLYAYMSQKEIKREISMRGHPYLLKRHLLMKFAVAEAERGQRGDARSSE